MSDPLSDFVAEGRKEKGECVTRIMKKEVDGAGFCLKARGPKKALAKLFADLDKVDLGEHQP